MEGHRRAGMGCESYGRSLAVSGDSEEGGIYPHSWGVRCIIWILLVARSSAAETAVAMVDLHQKLVSVQEEK